MLCLWYGDIKQTPEHLHSCFLLHLLSKVRGDENQATARTDKHTHIYTKEDIFCSLASAHAHYTVFL